MNESRLYKLKHILILSKALADEVSQRLSDGSDFEDLAIEYSACPSAQYAGSLGWMTLEEFPENLHEGIKALTIQQWEGLLNLLGGIITFS
jgi:parvulin-like peptidyl-prolyl isomerase